MYYLLRDNSVIKSDQPPPDAKKAFWGTLDAATAWGVSRVQACRLMPRCDGYMTARVGGRVAVLVPAGAPKPSGGLVQLDQMANQKFGHLVAIKSIDGTTTSTSSWLCRCDCGNTCVVSAKDLRAHGQKSCGCLKKRQAAQLQGRVFGRLTAIEPTDQRADNSVVWLCRCSCGNSTYVPSGSLIKGNTQSCGCLGRTKGMAAIKAIEAETPANINGTRVHNLHRKTPIKSNTSGFLGVSWSRQKQKWEAYITFKGKKYNLGFYGDINKAVEARRIAQDKLHGEFLGWYYTQYPAHKPKMQD